MAPRKTKRKKLDVSQQWLARYHDPRAPGSLGGVGRFARAHQIPLKKAQRVLQRDWAYTLHKPRRRRFPTLPVIVGGLDDQWVADLVEVQPLAKYNRGIRYLLTVLDILSKYAWVQPLKAKTRVALVKSFNKILKQGRQPNRLQTDRGTEFYNRTFQRWLKDQGVNHFSTEGDAKAAVVERFNRTLKERLYRYFTAANTLRFDDALPQLVEGPSWTEEVFVVHRVTPGPVPTYKIREWDDTPVQGTFYDADVQKVHVSNQALFRIEKVLKRQKDHLLVKWKGWPDKYNSWIASQDVTPLQKKKKKKKA